MTDDDIRDDDGMRTLRDNLARVVSHDLRAQVRAIRGFGKLLDAGSTAAIDAREYVSRIREAAEQLDGLLVDLVDWLRVDAAEVKRAPVDLSLLADWATMELLDAHPGRDARVEVQPEMQAIGDEHQLRQMMQRLLHAAWQHAGSDAPIRIEVSAMDDAGATVLRVRDHGRDIGEPASEFATLRDPRDGTIGLTIARRIAERHGGALESHSDASGTTVRVRLPD